MSDNSKTHFGYQTVDADKKSSLVAGVFHSVASRYDVMNDLMSLGIHRVWKALTIHLSNVRQGHKVLDLAGGTGDLALKFSKRVGEKGQVVLGDINYSMLDVGRDRLIDQAAYQNIDYIQCDAECLPFADNHFDCITIAFGLRNVTDKNAALKSMYRVLKPGGQCMILEFSKPTTKPLQKIYDAYSFNILPKIGQLVANDKDSYQYLVESIRMHPDQDTLKSMMQDAGFVECSYHNLTGGIVALHKGYKA